MVNPNTYSMNFINRDVFSKVAEINKEIEEENAKPDVDEKKLMELYNKRLSQSLAMNTQYMTGTRFRLPY